MHASIRACLLAMLSLLLVTACAAPALKAPMSPALTIVVVRHAEKTNDDPRDPALSAAGQARALRLATLLRGHELVAAYASDFRRTRQTATPAASSQGIVVTTYDVREPAATFADTLRRTHASGTVLVVGHSNTVPELVAALCGCAVAPIGEDDYGNLYEITFGGPHPSLAQRRY
jgi:broad specificity phosphatase PhoE